MAIRALIEGCINGVGKFHKTSIFPCGIFQCMAGINRKPGDPNYDLYRLALKSTAQRIYPNYANCDWRNAADENQVLKIKNDILNSLTEVQQKTLIENCKRNPELLTKLGLEIIDE